MDSQEKNTPEVESHLQENTLLRFRVGPFRFAVPAVEVEGIIVPPVLTRIPLNPPHSKGVFMHHQRLASAISLRSKFGLSDSDDPEYGQLILGEVSVGLVAFWVDEVYETVDTSELEWREMPQFIPHAAFDSFAVKGDEVVLSTTMQQLYEVPAETAAQLLQGVRNSFDLPQDIPPVASEAQLSPEEPDVFGDIMTDQASETGATRMVSETKPPLESALSASPTSEARTEETEPGQAAPEDSSATTSNAAKGATNSPKQNHVVNFPGNKSGQASERNIPRTSSGTPRSDKTAQFSAARVNIRSNPGADVSARRVASDRARPDPASEHRRRGFVGGTHAAAVGQLHEPRYRQPDAPIYTDGASESRQQSSKGWAWLLLALLVLALLVYLFWPGKKQGTIGSIPTQNYQSTYSFRESTPSSTVREPRASYEAVSPPPVVREAVTPPPADTSTETVEQPVAPVVQGSNEIYRLEGKEVTVTVERSQPVDSADKSSTAQLAIDSTSTERSKPMAAGYEEFVHIVVKGDTLWDIAAKYLKNPFRYPELARLSQISNPDLIYPGDTVRIRAKRQ